MELELSQALDNLDEARLDITSHWPKFSIGLSPP